MPERGASLAFGSLCILLCKFSCCLHCSISLFPACQCCVEKLLSGWLSSHAGARSQPGLLDPFARLAWVARRSVEPAWLLDDCLSCSANSLLIFILQYLFFQLASVVLRNCCRAGCLRTERRASPTSRIHLPGWLGSHAGAWGQPGCGNLASLAELSCCLSYDIIFPACPGSVCQAGLGCTPERGASLAFGSLCILLCKFSCCLYSLLVYFSSLLVLC